LQDVAIRYPRSRVGLELVVQEEPGDCVGRRAPPRAPLRRNAWIVRVTPWLLFRDPVTPSHCRKRGRSLLPR
jgi:hypothetical protein